MCQVTQLSSVVCIQKAGTTLLLDHPFFGTLLFRLGARECFSIATTCGASLLSKEFWRTRGPMTSQYVAIPTPLRHPA
jgi:hypothetical protein